MDDAPHKVIIVVDMLNGFLRRGNLASGRLDSITPRVHEHLEREAKAGADLVFLVDTHVPDDPEIVPELAPLAELGTVVRKNRYSGFHGTALDDVLRRLGPDVVEVVGVCTDICVLHTVADLRNRDYPVVVRRDLVETFDAPGHDADEVNAFALAHMRGILGARVE